jgi:site-specific DNA-cytosine methylase
VAERKVIRAIDLCAGAGGWAVAARGLPIDVTHAFDFWPVACKTYSLNHPGTKVVCGDLRDPAIQAQVRALRGRVDLVVGGIPCEWLSVYRNVGHDATRVKAGELDDQRKTLDAALDLVRDLKPRWWCLEDVTGLVKELPPLMPYRIIDAAGYSPQRRKRVFVGEFPPPAPGTCTQVLRDRLRPGPYRIGGRTFDREPVKSKSFRAPTCYAAYPHEKAPTVCAHSSRRDAELAVIDPRLPGGKRQMEWQEAARLQGFPEDYLFYGSPTDVFLQVGRAIQIDLGRAILGAICEEV